MDKNFFRRDEHVYEGKKSVDKNTFVGMEIYSEVGVVCLCVFLDKYQDSQLTETCRCIENI